MCTEVNSAMGLQATAATKRKHELTFDGKDANTTYTTNCPPPLKAGRWSMNNNNYVESLDEQTKIALKSKMATKATTNGTVDDAKMTLINNNNNNNDGKNCSSGCNRLASVTNSTCISNGKEVTKTTTQNGTAMSVNSLVSSLIPQAADLAPTTPLPPIPTTAVPEDSIAKLEVVAAVPCEPWVSSTEPVDCISKLQAVAVPSDPWGSISTRSTLATTLLSADELDDDDDDFEDDYEEEESIIPTYCPLRYHPFPSAVSTPTAPQQATRIGSYSPAQGYGSRPNYYSEPFPQQNCSRTGSPQHTRNMPNGFSQWHNNNANSQQFYGTSEVTYPSQQQQQTIRCAENGKSYLDLGCSTPPPSINTATPTVPSVVPPFANIHVGGPNLDARHPLKRCCDARGTWCNTNKNCYRDIRLKIRNLSMFKLSRFRQVSEQSLYRSVLICNTLKRIDREIEAEAKELHQVAVAHAAHHQQQQLYHQQHLPHHLQHHPHLNQSHSHQLQLQPQLQQLQQQQQHHDYAPVMNCTRLASLDYQLHPAQQQQQQQQQQNSHLSVHYQQHQQQQQHYQPERLDTPPPQQSPYLHTTTLLQKPPTSNFSLNHSSTCHNNNSSTTTATIPLHPYDHYPFRESQSGRATPFPNCQPVIPAASNTTTLLQPQQTTPVSTTSTSTITPSPTPPAASPPVTTTLNSSSQCDSDPGYAEDDSTRTINWSSVLSLSSQSALDPLSNDLFSILPAGTSVTNPATAVPVPIPTTLPNSTISTLTTIESASTPAPVAISGTFTTVQSSTTTAPACSQADDTTSSASSSNSSTTATFTTLTTIPSTTYSLTSSYVSSMTTSNASNSSSSTWEYGFLDMEFGLGSEFTELMPSCKLSSDELFKNGLTPVSTSRYSSVHDNELEQPAHIMVGS